MRNEFSIMKEVGAKDINAEISSFDRLQVIILTKVVPLSVGVILAGIWKGLF